MSDPFIGQIIGFGGNFAPRGWAFCEGQLIAIAQNQALFSILGTMYGGDGRTTFALPDLRGRVAISAGQGPGLPNYAQGSKSGSSTVTLSINQMPNHSHTVECSTAAGNVGSPSGAIPAAENVAAADVYTQGAADATMKSSMINAAGGNQSHDNMQPYQTIRWIIALQGIFPSRN